MNFLYACFFFLFWLSAITNQGLQQPSHFKEISLSISFLESIQC